MEATHLIHSQFSGRLQNVVLLCLKDNYDNDDYKAHTLQRKQCQKLCPFLVSDILLLSRLAFKLQLVCELILNSLFQFLLCITIASHT